MVARNKFQALLLAGAMLAGGYALADTVIVQVVPTPSTTAMRYDALPPYAVVTSPSYEAIAPRYYSTQPAYYSAPPSSVWVPGYWSWNEARHRNEWHEGRYVAVDRADYAYPTYRYGVPDYPYPYEYRRDFGTPPTQAHWEGGR